MDAPERNEDAPPEKRAGNPLMVILGLCGAFYYGGKLSGLFRLDREAENVLDLLLIGGLVLTFLVTTFLRQDTGTSDQTAEIRETTHDDHC